MQLPEPALTLTLPSIHDGTVLDCRVYHPLTLSSALSSTAAQWRPKHAAVVAHPYGPLGGSYDDLMVEELASLLLRKGFVVATFNFRGAGHSAGRTSWTARPERDDYTTVAGFLAYYVHHLELPDNVPVNADPPVLVLAGYSYGAMVTAQLPPLPAMLAPFAFASLSSEAGQVRHTAETLATQQRAILHRSTGGLRVGEAGSPKKSHEGKRSFSLDEAEEKLKKGVHDLIHKTRHPRQHSAHERSRSRSRLASNGNGTPPDVMLSPLKGFVMPKAAYLLISPLQGLVSNLATMSRSPSDAAAEAKLRQCPTLAAFGDNDVFVPVGKLRSWAAKMESRGGSVFKSEEVDGAGHFWVEEGVLGTMMGKVKEFVDRLV